MKKIILASVLILLVSLIVNGQAPADLPVDYSSSGSEVKPLYNLSDQKLTNALYDQLNSNPRWKELIAAKKMAVSLVDMQDPYDARFAAINGDEMMYAASLPKIAILLAAEDALENGELEETEEVKKDMRIMISRSDNSAATRMIDRLSYEKIASVMTDPRYNLYDESMGGGLWVGKRYARSGERLPDPMKGLSHAATATQVARFYYMMAHGQLVSPERSAQMLGIMKDPELHHKFVNTLIRIAPEASIFRKSGSWSTYHSDSAMVWEDGWRKYILVALIDDAQGEAICRQLVSVVEEVLKANQPLREGTAR